MKKLMMVVALMASLGLVGGLMASPASAFFFGGGCGTGFGSGLGFMAPAACAPAMCAPVYCAPVMCAPYYYPPCVKVKKAKKAKKMKKK